MGILNLMALVVFATSLFTRSVDPVVPQVAFGLHVATATAAMLSTGFTLPYALVQPMLGALADMLSKTRLIIACMLVLGLVTLAASAVGNFETLLVLRIVAGCTAGGVFPIAFAVVADNVPVAQRQAAIGRILAAALGGNLLGATAAGVIGDLIGWRGVFVATGAVDLIVLMIVLKPLRALHEPAGGFDLSTLLPNYRAIFGNPLAKYCYGAVFIEAIFLFGVFPYMAVLLNAGGEARASIAGVVLAGFALGGILYSFAVPRALALLGERWMMIAGGFVMGFCLVVISLRAPWQVEFVNFVLLGFGFYLLHGCIQVYVTELAPAARATATSGHTGFFFFGQAIGPVVYGFASATVGITPVLLTGAVVLIGVGLVCAATLRRSTGRI